MGKAIAYCTKCGAQVHDAPDGAETLCRKCSGPAPAAPASTRRAAAKPPPPAAASDSRTLLLVAGAVVVAGFIALIVVLSSGGAARPEPKRLEAADPNLDLLLGLERFAAASKDPTAVLQKCEELGERLRGTPHELRLRVVEEKAREAKGLQERDRKLEVFFASARGLREKDPDFRQRAEMIAMCDAAAKTAGGRRAEVDRVRDAYDAAYEARAAEAAKAARDEAGRLAGEGRFAEARTALDAFPEPLRASKAAAEIETLRADLDRRQAASRAWIEPFRAAGDRIGKSDYPGAKTIYLEALKTLPATPPEDSWTLYCTGLYNLACVYSVESKPLKDAAKKAAGDAAFRHLEAALRAGYGRRSCSCHKGGGIEHISKDSDIDPIRADPRLAELLRKFR